MPSPTARRKRKRVKEEEGVSLAGPGGTELALSAEEEATLRRYFEAVILKASPQFEELHESRKIEATALTFFKRFYLSNSLLEFSPHVLWPTCLFLACKTEGTMSPDKSIQEHVPLIGPGNLCERIRGIADVTAEEIINMELVVLEGLGFHLHCFHPYRPLRGLLFLLLDVAPSAIEAQGREEPPPRIIRDDELLDNDDGEEAVSPFARAFHDGVQWIKAALQTDLPLLYPPAVLACATLFVLIEEGTLADEGWKTKQQAAAKLQATQSQPLDVDQVDAVMAKIREAKATKIKRPKTLLAKLERESRWAACRQEGGAAVKHEAAGAVAAAPEVKVKSEPADEG